MQAPACRLWAVDGGPDDELTVSEQMLQSQARTHVPNQTLTPISATSR